MADDQKMAELEKKMEALEHRVKIAEGRAQTVYGIASDLKKEIKGLGDTVATAQKNFSEVGKELKGVKDKFRTFGATVKSFGNPRDIKNMLKKR